jgi:hypothetical protein
MYTCFMHAMQFFKLGIVVKYSTYYELTVSEGRDGKQTCQLTRLCRVYAMCIVFYFRY